MKYLEKIICYLLYLLIFLLPWQTRWIWNQGQLNGGPWEYGSFSIYAVDIVLIFIVILSLFLSSRSQLNAKRWWVLIIGFLLISIASVFWSANKGLSWYAFAKLAEGILLLWVILKIQVRWRNIGIAFASAGFIQSVLAIFQFFSQRVIASKWLGMASHDPGVLGDFVVETASGRFLRAYGSLPHPNMLAGFLVICLIILIGFLFAMYKDKKPNIISIIITVTSFVVIYYGLILTFSRSAWLAFVLLVAMLLTISLWQRDRFRLRIIGPVTFWIILVTVFSIIMIPEIIQTRTIDSGRLEMQSSAERTEYFNDAVGLFRKNWYQGVGIGNYTQALYDIDGTQESWAYQPVHLVYFLVTVELGVFGGLLFLLLAIRFLHTAFLLQFREMRKHTWFLTYSISFTAVLFISFFEHYFWSLSFGVLLFWLLLGLWLRRYREMSVDK